MLDFFTISTAGGLILFRKNFITFKSVDPANEFFYKVLIESQPVTELPLKYEYKFDPEHQLYFLTGYQKILNLNYIENLLEKVQLDFIQKFGQDLEQDFTKDYEERFLSILYALEDASESKQNQQNSQISKNEQKQSQNQNKSNKKKKERKWDGQVSAEEAKQLDFSNDTETDDFVPTHLIDQTALDKMKINKKDGINDILEMEIPTKTETKTSSWLPSIFQQKTLTKETLGPAVKAMKEHLMHKNVAKEVAEFLCNQTMLTLLNQPVGAFTNLQTVVQNALEPAVQKILTPKTSVDLLRDIQIANQQKRTYAISFIGVNGVGKSTNLSKVCFWLLQNQLSVLIAACDTFRSGAVEQLKTHVTNLKKLDGSSRVELYQRGYGKDAAGIAKEAIQYANQNKYDIVLIDTAGRMQDNEPLMRSLAKLVAVNRPDKIIFVGEALVGNEAVDQLTKFNQALKDFSGIQNPQQIDGILLTKFDTIDDKVGAALTMTYTTGQPVLFVGTGQTYTDLKRMNIKLITQTLISK